MCGSSGTGILSLPLLSRSRPPACRTRQPSCSPRTKGEGGAVDPAVSQAKFDRDVAHLLPESNNFVRENGWEFQEHTWPLLRVVLTHPTSKRAVGFRFTFDEWDDLPPSLSLYDPTTGVELGWDKWPQGGWNAGNVHP